MTTAMIQTMQAQGANGTNANALSALQGANAAGQNGVFGALFASLMMNASNQQALGLQNAATGQAIDPSLLEGLNLEGMDLATLQSTLQKAGLLQGGLASEADLQAALSANQIPASIANKLEQLIQNSQLQQSGAQNMVNALQNAAETTPVDEASILDGNTTLSIDGSTLLSADETSTEIGKILLIDGSDLGTEAGLLTRLTQKIQDLQEQSEAPGILFNLTPEQMTQLQEDIALALENGDLPEPPEGFNFIMVNLAPTDNMLTSDTSPELAFINTLPFVQGPTLGKLKNAGNGQGGQNAAQGQNVSGQLNSLMQQTAASESSAAAGSAVSDDLIAGGAFDDLLDIQSPADKFSALLKNASKIKGSGDAASTANAAQATGNAAANTENAANAQATLGALSGQQFSDGSLIAGLGWDSETLFSMGFSPLNGSQYQSAAGGDLVNLTLQSRQAGQGHPGTSLVAATLTKAAGNPENKAITLQLDPPELGRIEVRMQFGKDRSLKATIISEKPEAHMLLQRDAQTLERALQDSGLDTDGNLEFVLADDNQQFSQDGRHDGSRNQAAGGHGEDSEAETLIESTMTWVVDPESGHTHYSILV